MHVNAAAVLRALVAAALGLVCLHLLVVLTYLARWPVRGVERFYLDLEGNVPTWFASALLLTAALLLGVIAALKRATRDAFSSRWALLGLIFLGLSLDEAASFHEILIKPLVKAFDLTGALRFGWVLAGGVFALCVAVFYLRFLASLPRRTGALFVLAGGCYVLGALGFEMLGAYFFLPERGIGTASLVGGWDLLPYMLAMTVEESLELAGVLLFIHGLLDYLKASAPAILLRVA